MTVVVRQELALMTLKQRSCLIPMCLLLGIILAGCGGKEKAVTPKKPAVSTTKPVLVEIGAVKKGLIESILERSSALEAEARVEVRARTQNPAIELLVEEGDIVEQDQVLLRLESDRQKTDYDQSMSQLEQAEIEFERQDKLYKQSLISEAEYRNAKFAYNQAKLRSETARRELEYTEVRAPIKGTITSRTVKVGDQVTTGVLHFRNHRSRLNGCHHSRPRTIPPETGSRDGSSPDLNHSWWRGLCGLRQNVSPVVEARAGTVKVVVGVKELGALRPGMWVDVELVLETKEDAILIPKRSIVYDNDQTYAFNCGDRYQQRKARRPSLSRSG